MMQLKSLALIGLKVDIQMRRQSKCIHTHTATGIPGSKSLTVLSTPRSSLTTAGVSNTSSGTPPILTSTPAQSLDQQQFKPLSSIVEAAGLSQVVANLTAGMFSSSGAQLPPSLVSTLTQAGSVSGGAMQQVSASSSSQNMSVGSSGVSVGSAGSAGVTTDVTHANQSDYSQVQPVHDSSSTLTVSSSIL
jgi:hypothetical protein